MPDFLGRQAKYSLPGTLNYHYTSTLIFQFSRTRKRQSIASTDRKASAGSCVKPFHAKLQGAQNSHSADTCQGMIALRGLTTHSKTITYSCQYDCILSGFGGIDKPFNTDMNYNFSLLAAFLLSHTSQLDVLKVNSN